MTLFHNLLTSCRQGNMNFIKESLHSIDGTQFSTHPKLIEEAILGNQLEIVQYLLTSKDLIKHCNIHYETDLFLVIACRANRLAIVEFLLTSTELNEHCDVNTLSSAPIRVACMNGHPQIVDYLMSQHNVMVSSFLYDIVLKKREIEKTTSINLKNPKNLDDYKNVLEVIDHYQKIVDIV